jgi:uncharacterized protein (DUF885 family)
MALIFLGGSLVLPLPEAQAVNGSLQLTSGSQVQAENLTRLLQELQELAQSSCLNPEQRAEIKSLMSQARHLRQKFHDSSPDSFQLRHRRQLQDIKLRLDAIKNTLPPRPLNIKRYRSAIV